MLLSFDGRTDGVSTLVVLELLNATSVCGGCVKAIAVASGCCLSLTSRHDGLQCVSDGIRNRECRNQRKSTSSDSRMLRVAVDGLLGWAEECEAWVMRHAWRGECFVFNGCGPARRGSNRRKSRDDPDFTNVDMYVPRPVVPALTRAAGAEPLSDGALAAALRHVIRRRPFASRLRRCHHRHRSDCKVHGDDMNSSRSRGMPGINTVAVSLLGPRGPCAGTTWMCCAVMNMSPPRMPATRNPLDDRESPKHFANIAAGYRSPLPPPTLSTASRNSFSSSVLRCTSMAFAFSSRYYQLVNTETCNAAVPQQRGTLTFLRFVCYEVEIDNDYVDQPLDRYFLKRHALVPLSEISFAWMLVI
ncbi:uncharacterized protein MYCFIDRAFT_179216 [Pseudocercospora fijiensis CIRAD86]|uniref:Uncharacterized protein n=1 Tax=Pseudocercospora fijiensis (strain CIRAD86) TaxID=383855 RepID=M3AJT2_PSEFD|nr:uncharacterized protein MYCFIDRAFT_179216 [Pseudocercospora fijiensis CIRAD86]EME77717.1 hypothetical protein MYCFIDRAFT_179216 [Pseudocercospora fijiensis CIRAD86]